MTRELICLVAFTLTILFTQNVFADFIEDRNKYFCERNDINFDKAQGFLNKFNNLVQARDKKNIAKMVHYPVQVYKRKKTGNNIYYYIKDEEDFLAQYEILFNERAKKLLLEHHELDCDSLGYVSTAAGNFYFQKFDNELKIVIMGTIKE